jgi:hypothetical protein
MNNFFCRGWLFDESLALSRSTNPNRAQLQSDVDRFLASGGTIKPVTGMQRLGCTTGPNHGAATTKRVWAVTPIDMPQWRGGEL